MQSNTGNYKENFYLTDNMTNNNDLDDGVGMPGPFSNSNVRARRVYKAWSEYL